VENYGRARQATDDNIIRRMRLVCWITKAIDTHSEYVILIAFSHNNSYTNAPHCHVILKLPIQVILCVCVCVCVIDSVVMLCICINP